MSTLDVVLREITHLAAILGQHDDELRARLETLETLLRANNPGTRINFGDHGDGRVYWGKHAGHWRLLYVWNDDTVPLTNAPRHVRALFRPYIDDPTKLFEVVIEALRLEIKLRTDP